MKKILSFSIMIFMISSASACSADIHPETTPALPQATPTGTILSSRQTTPTSTLLLPPEATLSSEIENACVQTIEKFLEADPCKNWDEYHNLIYPEGWLFRVTPMANNDPACNLVASKTILKIMTAAEHYQGYVPGAISPRLPNEYVFYVEYNIEWQPGVVPVSENPFRIFMWMGI